MRPTRGTKATHLTNRWFSVHPLLRVLLVIAVEDFPSEDVQTSMRAGPFDLLGLFQGIGLAQDGATPETGRIPNMVFLYRRAILDYWAEHEETLGAIVTHVLVHEIGHHFGLSDEDMYAIEDQVP